MDQLENGLGTGDSTIVDSVASNLKSITAEQSYGQGMSVGNLNACVDTVRRLARLRVTMNETTASKTEINVSGTFQKKVLELTIGLCWQSLILYDKLFAIYFASPSLFQDFQRLEVGCL
jgi:hypothetical protein